MAVKVKLTAKNLDRFVAALGRMKKNLDDKLSPAARGITQVLLEMVEKTFANAARGRNVKGWDDLSPFTLFIRKNRVSAPNKDAKILNDRGILRNSNIPFVRREGAEFGIANPLKYASTHQFGGKSRAQTIMVNNPRKGRRADGKERIKQYAIRIKGGADIPARPFFPSEGEYLPKVMKALRAYAKQSRGDLPGA